MPDPSRELLTILTTTLGVSGTAVVISMMLGLPLGTWMGLSRFPGKSWVTTLVYVGMALPPVVVGLLVYLLLSRSGWLGPWDWLFTTKAMILAQVILVLPLVVGIIMAAVAAVPSELQSQLRGLGATPWQARWTILWEARAGVVLALATALGRSFSEVGAVLMVGGNIEGHTRVLTTAIVLETSKGHFYFALMLGAILLSIALAMNAILVRFQGRPAA
jgi:tungstate transport system permease protein